MLRRISRIVFVCLCSSFLFGFNLSVFNSTAPHVILQLRLCPFTFQVSDLPPDFKSPVQCHYGKIMISTVNALFFLATAIGAWGGGHLGDRLGRKASLGVASWLWAEAGVLTSILIPLARLPPVGIIKDTEFQLTLGLLLFLIGRTITGLSVGIAGVLSLLYLLEAIPREEKRGLYGVLMQVWNTVGICAANLVGLFFLEPKLTIDPLAPEFAYFVTTTFNAQWCRVLMVFPGLLSLICGLILFSLPESPVYVMLQDPSNNCHLEDQHTLEPEAVLAKLRDITNNSSDQHAGSLAVDVAPVMAVLMRIDEDFGIDQTLVRPPNVLKSEEGNMLMYQHPRLTNLLSQVSENRKSGSGGKITLLSLLLPIKWKNLSVAEARRLKGVRHAFLVGLFYVSLTQWSGITVLMSSANVLLLKFGFPTDKLTLFASLLTLLNVIATLPAVELIERFGRKTILLGGCSGLTAGLLVVTFSVLFLDRPLLFVIVGFCGYVVSFAAGVGPLLFFYLNEIFPSDVRSMAVGALIAFNWVMCGASVVFSQIVSQQVALIVFTVASISLLLHIQLNIRETKGLAVNSSPYILAT